MSELSPWDLLWEELDAVMIRFGEAQAEATGEFLKGVRVAVTKYGEELDPDSFDDLGQHIEPEKSPGGLKVLDGTPTAISKYLRELEEAEGQCLHRCPHCGSQCSHLVGHPGRHVCPEGHKSYGEEAEGN